MKKIIKFIFLIIVCLSFSIKIANAQGFWVKVIDTGENGAIDFTVTAYNYADQDYYIGFATPDHEMRDFLILRIPAGGSNSTPFAWGANQWGFLVFDIYLTLDPDSNIYYWTSKGDAFLCRFGGIIGILISWEDTDVLESFSPQGDEIYGVRVPIPSALWLLGSGAITLGLIRKKLLIR